MSEISLTPAGRNPYDRPFGIRHKLAVQWRVVRALLVRELMTRFGRNNVGFFWLILEPLILMVGIICIWTIMGRSKHGVSIFAFALTGYSILTMWRHILGRCIGCFGANMGLMSHQNVHPLDTLIARVILETLGCLLAFFLAFTVMLLFDYVEPIDDYLVLLGGWFGMALFSMGIGMVFAGLAEVSPVVERLSQPLQYMMLPISGTFYMLYWLPYSAQKILIWVPMVNANEMFRHGFLGDTVPTHYSASYLYTTAMISIAVGLFTIQATSKHLKTEG